MNNRNNSVVIILLLITIYPAHILYSQTVYTPLNSSIYNYLDRLATEHIIILNDEVKPYSRKMIAGYLITAEEKSARLSAIEKEELKWYKEEYAEEMKSKNERWFLYQHSDSLFSIRVTPMGGYGISRIGDAHGHTRWWGISTYGNISDLLGVSFSYKDIGQFGGNIDYKKVFTPERTYAINSYPAGGIEFSDVKGAVNFTWDWGSVSLIKDDIRWGHGNFGQLILSDKPESYPQIRLFIKPAEWFRFYYIHGWLNSLVYDSSKFYYNHLESTHPIQYKSYINKYIAANMLTVTPFTNLDVSIGNSVIYSGELRPEFFIPFLYYKVMDHNTGRGDVEDSNGQVYFDISSRNLPNFQFYSTVFIDCGSIRGLLKGDLHEWWCGYTMGAKAVNILIPNLDLIVEYTKLGPWVYEHKYDTETYKNSGVTLGDWLGQNADQLRIQADYKFSRPLTIHLYFEKLRKGGLADNSLAYFSTVTIPFLYGQLRKDFNIGITADYEILHDLYASGLYEYSEITDEDKTRTPDFLLGDKNNLSFTLSLGL
jgi:hypothetical protein